MSKEKFSTLSWLSEEGKAHLRYLDQIVEDKNFTALFDLQNNSEFSTTIHKILVHQYDQKQTSLNQYQMNLFLCMHLENAGQSSSILSFLQEWFPEYTNQVVNALQSIGAINSSIIIQKAIILLPKDRSWFYDTADEKTQQRLEELDRQFSDYPDGSMPNLYRKYAEDWKEQIISGIKQS